MKHKISVINKSNGKYKKEIINGRDHIVTTMMAIEGDSVMNELFYPNEIVMASMYQLEMKPAPDRHPSHDGSPISAFNPLAMNANNFGGFTRSPRKSGKQVITDLVIDVEVANRTKRGSKIINKIKAGEPIGVSTGLLAEVSNEEGKVGTQKFNGKVQMIEFDHVAVLLDAMPAGENTYTINHDEKIKPNRRMIMDKLELDLTSLAVADRIKLSELKVNELLDHVNHKVTIDEAKKILIDNDLHVYAIPVEKVEEFIANQADFLAFQNKVNEKVEETKAFIVANSSMTIDQLSNLNTEQLENLSKSVAPKNTYIAPDGKRKDNALVLLDDNAIAEK